MGFDVKNSFTTTDHQAAFWAWDLSKRSQADSYAKIAGSMMGAQEKVPLLY